MVCHHGLALATVNLPTEFEVSISTHYEDVKGNNKVEMEWFAIVTVSQGDWK